MDYVRHPGTLSSMTEWTVTPTMTPVVPPVLTTSGGGGGIAAADGGLSAIIMECLPGEDMHVLRDRHCQDMAVEYGGGHRLLGGERGGTETGS